MRWYGQLAVVAVLAGAGYAGWQAYKSGRLADVPVIGSYVGKPAGETTEAAAPRGRRDQGPVLVDVDKVETARIVETHEAVGTGRAFESIMVTAKVAGIVQEITFQEGQQV